MQSKFNIKTLNSFLFSFFIFQYAFCAPISLFIGNTVPVVVTTLLGGFIVILNNWNKIDSSLYLFICCFLMILIGQFLCYPDLSNGTLNVISSFISIGIVFSFVGAISIDSSIVMKYCKNMAIINYFFLFLFFQKKLMSGVDGDLSMRFGYALLPSLIFFLYEIINNRSRLYVVLFVLGFMQVFIWGARGAVLVLLLFYILYLVYNNKLNKYWILFLLVLYLFRGIWVDLILAIVENIPFETRKLHNYLTMLTIGVAESSSGRDVIYNEAIQLFQTNIWGCGVGFYNEGASGRYPHNLFLEVAVEWGILGLLVVFCMIVVFLYKLYVEKNMVNKNVMLILFTIMFGRLLVSSSYWERPEFWMCLGMFLFTQRKEIVVC